MSILYSNHTFSYIWLAFEHEHYLMTKRDKLRFFSFSTKLIYFFFLFQKSTFTCDTHIVPVQLLQQEFFSCFKIEWLQFSLPTKYTIDAPSLCLHWATLMIILPFHFCWKSLLILNLPSTRQRKRKRNYPLKNNNLMKKLPKLRSSTLWYLCIENLTTFSLYISLLPFFEHTCWRWLYLRKTTPPQTNILRWLLFHFWRPTKCRAFFRSKTTTTLCGHIR